MSFHHDRQVTKDQGKMREGFEFLPQLFKLAQDKKFNRFEVSQYSFLSEIFCVHWVEKIENDHFCRSVEHWNLEVIYRTLNKMYNSDYTVVRMDLAFSSSMLEVIGEGEGNLGEDLL